LIGAVAALVALALVVVALLLTFGLQ